MRVVLVVLLSACVATLLRVAYVNVAQQVNSPDASARLDFHGTAVPPADFTAVNNSMSKTMPDTQNGFAANVVSQNQQFNNRMEDLRNYARNPAGWHGAPPQ